MQQPDLMDKIVSLCKRRGFVFPGSEIYGGLANSWDYGPLGVELKNNIKQLWWKRFVQQRDDVVGLDAALIMNPKVWEASGHVATFSDPLVEDTKTHERFRLDHLLEDAGVNPAGMDLQQMWQAAQDKALKSPSGNALSEPKRFNLMFKTYIGPAEEQTNVAYFRPETAQAMFVQFKNVLDTARKRLPFGIAQQGKAFRNEITPGNFIFRTREFEQMEIEYFIPVPNTDADWSEYFESWRQAMINWMQNDLGLDMAHIHELEVPKEDLAHYSKRTIDFEYEFPFGKKELYGLAYRTDFDLSNHEKASGQELKYTDPETGEKTVPHVIEPTWGVDRTILAVLSEHYREDGEGDKKRVWLQLPPKLAPYKVAVFPLLKNKPELVEKARGIYNVLKEQYMVAWDDRGNVGKRYYSQDEIGTPFCITVDFDTLENGTVTVRDRNTAEQVRISVAELEAYLKSKIV
ncbi:MAG: glycine--tRNA ligase [Candidatus Doudnabacteria bacterium]|nr:glycine--tRNA ligase [Candidatus Doudnabacteria bacterium]